MKKLTISSIPSAEILSAEEMKLLLGGETGSEKKCEGTDKNSCHDECAVLDDGELYYGTCGWSTNSSKCYCAYVKVGPLVPIGSEPADPIGS